MSPELDKAVLEYLLDERAAGRPVSNKVLQAKASKLVPQLSVPSTLNPSNMWVKRKCNQISIRCRINDWFSTSIMNPSYTLLGHQSSAHTWSMIWQNLKTKLFADLTWFHQELIMLLVSDPLEFHVHKQSFTVALAAKGNGDKLYTSTSHFQRKRGGVRSRNPVSTHYS